VLPPLESRLEPVCYNLAKQFLRGNAEQIEEILDALCSLGLARKMGGGDRGWHRASGWRKRTIPALGTWSVFPATRTLLARERTRGLLFLAGFNFSSAFGEVRQGTT